MSFGQNYSKRPQSQKGYEYDITPNRNAGKSPIRPQTSNPDKLGRNEIQEIKRQVQEVNYMVNKRKRSAVKIQKIWRGYITRKKFNRIKAKLMEQKRERLKKQKRKQEIRRRAPNIICDAIYRYVLKKRNREKELLRKYLHHCATMIQKVFRGAITRAKLLKTKRHMEFFQELLLSGLRGWKTRKVMKHDSIVNILQDITDLHNLTKELVYNDDPDAESIKEEIPDRLRNKKRQFSDQFYKLYFRGTWAKSRDTRTAGRRRKNDEEEYHLRGNYKEVQRKQTRRTNQRDEEDEYNDNYRRHERQYSGKQNRDYNDPPYNEEEFYDDYNGRGHQDRREHSRQQSRYEDEDMDYPREGLEERPVNKWAERENRDERPIKGRKGSEHQRSSERNDYLDDRPIKPMKGAQNEYEDEYDQPRGSTGLNAYNARDEIPIGGTGKGEYVIPPELQAEAFNNEAAQALQKKPKKEALKRKAKYDPRKAIEDAKKKEVEEEKNTPNKKSEEFRNIIKNARKFQDGVADMEETGKKEGQENKKKGGKKVVKKVKAEAKGLAERGDDEENVTPRVNQGDNDEVEEEQDDSKKEEKNDDGKNFRFLKRKSKAVVNQKLNWGKVGSRVSCWIDKSEQAETVEKAPPKSTERISVTKVKDPKVPPNKKAATTSKNEPQQKNLPNKWQGGKTENTGGFGNRNMGPNAEMGNYKKPAGYQQPAVQRQPHQPHIIRIEELEKAYHTNFLNKLNHITQKFYSESGARDPEEEYNSIIPILRLNSAFFFREDMDQYFDILAELDEEYQSLQIIN